MDKKYYQDEELEEFEELEDFNEFESLEEEFEENQDGEAEWEEEEASDASAPKHRRGLKIIAGILMILAVMTVVGIFGFRLEEVRVIGNKNYTDDEIKTLIGFPEDAPNTLLCYFKYIRYKVADTPFIEEIHVKMESRNMICIEVGETEIYGCLRSGKTYYYFDNRGVIQESLPERQDTVPLIAGIDVGDMEIGQEISIENQTIYKGIIELCGLLLEYDVAAEEIDIDENGHFTVYIDNALRVGFGIPVLLEEKAAEMANILPERRNMEETEQIRGILHLENYDSTKNSIIFTKEN